MEEATSTMQVEPGLICCIERSDTKNVQRLLLLNPSSPATCCAKHQNINPLHAAVINNSVPIVQLLLRAGADHTETDLKGLTPFHLACQLGYLDVAIAIHEPLRDGIFGTETGNGVTPLMSAAIYGHTATVGYLLECQVYDVNGVDENRRTALHFAADKGHTEIVNLLVGSGASTDRRDLDELGNTNNTALHLAAKLGHLSTVEGLLKHGADPTKENHTRCTPLSLASINGHAEVVEVLIKATEWDHQSIQRDLTCGYSPNPHVHDPLSLASLHNHPQVVQVLLKYPLHLAAIENAVLHALRGNSTESLCTLVSHLPYGFLRYDDTFLTSAFHTVIKHRATSCLGVLFDISRIDLNKKLFDRQYLLHIATVMDDAMGVLEMLKRGADVSVRDRYSGNILFTAFESRSCRVIRLFLHIVGTATRIDFSELQQQQLMSQVLYNDHQQEAEWTSVVELGYQKICSIAIKLNFHGKNTDGNSLLHMASYFDDHRILKSLLDFGLPADVRNNRGATPLMYHIFGAFAKGPEYVVQLRMLLKAGCDVNAVDCSGKNMALHSAVIQSRADLVWELVDAGASAGVWSMDMCNAGFQFHSIIQRVGIKAPVILLLILSGADLHELRRYITSKLGNIKQNLQADSISHYLYDNQEFQDKFKGLAENVYFIFEPLTLFDAVRLKLRLLFRKKIYEKSRRLPLPKLLQNAVALFDCYKPIDLE